MTEIAGPSRGFQVPTQALIAFLILTFAITWGLIGIYIVRPEWASTTFGEISGSHPFFFVATWAPAISALVLLLYYAGLSGVKGFLSRLLLWRSSRGWAAFILIGIPLVYVSGSLIKGGPVLAPLPPEGVVALITMLFMMLFLGPIEEFGWRGVAQPMLQRYVAPIWAGAIIGAIWGIWHLPAFYLSGMVFEDWSFLPFLVGNITLAILVTPIFNQSRGSLLWPMLFHWQLINPFWPDAQPYDTWILVALALVVVWWKRDALFTRDGSVTEVFPGERMST